MSLLAATAAAPDFLAQLALHMQSIPGGEKAFTVVMFILVLSVLVFVHEMGHFLAARSVGVRVEAFSIGFGPRLLGWVDKQKTHWQICLLPLGGYVQLFGQGLLEDSAEGRRSAKNPESFAHKTILQRAWVIVAGPLANIVFAVLLMIVVMATGEHKLKPEVGAIMPDMPATGVVMQGDVLRTFNGESIEDWDAFQKRVSDNGSSQIALGIERQGAQMTLQITPKVVEFTDLLGDTHQVGRIGIVPSYDTFVVKHPPMQALERGVARTWELTALTAKSLYKLLIGAIPSDNLTGPLGIADMAGQTASNGLYALALFLVIISVNLAVLNMVPLPVLDGGHLVFLAWEAVRGKPASGMVQEWATRVGLVLIISLALFSTSNDVKRFGWLGKSEPEAAAPAAAAAPAGTPAP